ALRDQDGVLEVVALPRHERGEHVLTECELAHVHRGPVGQHITRVHLVAGANDGLLRVTSGLVTPLVLDEVVDIGHLATFASGANDDAGGVDTLHHTLAASDHTHTGVASGAGLHARAN